MEFDWTGLVNYGALGVCLAYFIYKDNKTTKDLKDQQAKSTAELKETMNGVKEVVTFLKEWLIKKGD